MLWVIVIVIILAVLVAVALVVSAMKRSKDRVARERATELRSDAAQTVAAQQEQEARVREAEAEAARARARADTFDAQAAEERTSFDMTRAQQEDAVREADRIDPDVDDRSAQYQPDLNGSATRRTDPVRDHEDDVAAWEREQSQRDQL